MHIEKAVSLVRRHVKDLGNSTFLPPPRCSRTSTLYRSTAVLQYSWLLNLQQYNSARKKKNPGGELYRVLRPLNLRRRSCPGPLRRWRHAQQSLASVAHSLGHPWSLGPVPRLRLDGPFLGEQALRRCGRSQETGNTPRQPKEEKEGVACFIPPLKRVTGRLAFQPSLGRPCCRDT